MGLNAGAQIDLDHNGRSVNRLLSPVYGEFQRVPQAI